MSDEPFREIYISVDGEMSGPSRPGYYSLLSVGASLVHFPEDTFYAELKPLNAVYDPESMRINGLALSRLETEGLEPLDAVEKFRAWIYEASQKHYGKPVLVGYPDRFEWMFLDWYFQTFGGDNPFVGAIDIRSYAMGALDRPLQDTRKDRLPKELLPSLPHTHNALDDAREQGQLFQNLLEHRSKRILKKVRGQNVKPPHK